MAKLDTIKQFPLHALNWALVALILIAAPILASRQFAGVEITSSVHVQRLALGGFCVALALNLAGALLVFRPSRKLRRVCWEWSVVHAAFAIVFLLVLNDVVHFEWLRDGLEWVRDRLT